MSKVVKAVKKGIKKIAKGIKTGFKSITKSTLGKVLLFAAAVYLGGAAFGMWESPFAAVNGALTSQASQAVAAGELGTPAASAAAAAEGSGTALTAAEAASAGEAAVAGGELGTAASTANMVNPSIAHGLNTAGTQGSGILNSAMQGVKAAGKFAGENKMLTAMGFSAVSSAVAGEDARKAAKKEQDEMDKNLAVGGLDLGLQDFRQPIINAQYKG